MGVVVFWLFTPRQTRCWAGGLGIRARAWAGERIPGPPAPQGLNGSCLNDPHLYEAR